MATDEEVREEVQAKCHAAWKRCFTFAVKQKCARALFPIYVEDPDTQCDSFADIVENKGFLFIHVETWRTTLHPP